MAEQLKSVEKLEKEIKNRKRTTSFREGIFAIRHPLFLLYKPKLVIKFNRAGTKVKGEIRWLRRKTKLKVIKLRERQIVFGFDMDIIALELVINFTDQYRFEGFFDTPLGHLKVSGYYVDNCYGDKNELY